MRRMNQVLVLLLVIGVVLLWVVTPVDAGQRDPTKDGGPKPDGRFQVTTTSIAPDMGVSWADGRFSFKNQDYKFSLEADTMSGSDMLTDLAGQQITYEGLVYNLKNVADFAGTYTRVKPEVVRAIGGSSRGVFQNEKGVVLRVTRRIKSREDLEVRLLGDSFKVMLKDF